MLRVKTAMAPNRVTRGFFRSRFFSDRFFNSGSSENSDGRLSRNSFKVRPTIADPTDAMQWPGPGSVSLELALGLTDLSSLGEDFRLLHFRTRRAILTVVCGSMEVL